LVCVCRVCACVRATTARRMHARALCRVSVRACRCALARADGDDDDNNGTARVRARTTTGRRRARAPPLCRVAHSLGSCWTHDDRARARARAVRVCVRSLSSRPQTPPSRNTCVDRGGKLEPGARPRACAYGTPRAGGPGRSCCRRWTVGMGARCRWWSAAHAPAFPSRVCVWVCWRTPTESLLRCAVRNLHDARHVDVLARRAPPRGTACAREHVAQCVSSSSSSSSSQWCSERERERERGRVCSCRLLHARARARACNTRSYIYRFFLDCARATWARALVACPASRSQVDLPAHARKRTQTQ
jgi:hypothetical protein